MPLDNRADGLTGAQVRRHSPWRWNTWDTVAIVAIAVVAAAIRIPWLGAVALNPDESQYESHAAYLIDAGTSAFSTPIGPVYTIAVYQVLAFFFGPYCMPAVRILVLVASVAVAGLLYTILSRESGRVWGLLAALVFSAFNIYFEGLSANREWFAGPPLLLGILLYRLARDRTRGAALALLLASGFSCGVAIWFKEQAIFMALVSPCCMVYEALVARAVRSALGPVAMYVLGGLLAGGAYMLPLVWAGTLREHLDLVLLVQDQYATVRAVSRDPSAVAEMYFDRLYGHMPARRIPLVTYAFTAVAAVCMVVHVIRGPTKRTWLADEPDVPLFVLYVLLGLLAVRTGERFFPHYYLLLLPAMTGAMALGLRTVWRLPRESMWTPVAAFAVLAASLVDAGLQYPGQRAELATWWESHRVGLVFAAAVAVGVLVAWSCLQARRPSIGGRWMRRATGSFAMGLLGLGVVVELGHLALQTRQQVGRYQEYRQMVDRAFPSLVSYMRDHAAPLDCLHVWGWRAEIYSITRMRPASQFTIGSYIMTDAHRGQTGTPPVNEHYAKMLMDDLGRTRPRFIVDASRISTTMSRRAIYQLRYFPPLAQYLRTYYRRPISLDGCDIYVRRPDV